MIISDAQFVAAAYQLRVIELTMTNQLSALRDCQQWVGADADRFYHEWDVDIRAKLHSAASKLEALGFSPFI